MSGTEKTLCIWNLRSPDTPPHYLYGHTEEVLSVAFDREGKRLVSGAGDQTVRIWDLSSSKVTSRILRGNTKEVYTVAFSHSGQLVASGGWDGTMRIWDLQDQSENNCDVLDNHGNGIACLLFTPDDKAIISGSTDSLIRVWPVDPMDVVSLIRSKPTRNLTLDEWKAFVGYDVPYERTIAELAPGIGAPGGRTVQQ
jgi:WD40 repeat protein